jgi:hypothetical protein
LQARAQSAAAQAEKLDPNDTLAALIHVDEKPLNGNWLILEREYRALMARDPKLAGLPMVLAFLLISVGRVADAADMNARAITLGLPSPTLYFRHVVACMAADRLEEADRMAEKGMSLFPRHYGVWFTTFYLYLYTGRASRALAMARDVAARPPGIPVRNFDQIIAVAEAVISRAKADIDKAVEINFAAAHDGAGYAENAMLFASYLGRLDTAFAIAEAYYFARGFDPGLRSFSAEQGNFYRSRRTHPLFQLAAANMRADPRFDALVERIGLKRYWEQSGTQPDYLAKKA